MLQTAGAVFAAATVLSSFVLSQRAAGRVRKGDVRSLVSAHLDDRPPVPQRGGRLVQRRLRSNPLGFDRPVKPSSWFGPQADLEAIAQAIASCEPLTRAQVVADILRLGFRGQLSARRERSSELIVSLRMRGVISASDVVQGVKKWVRTLPQASKVANRCVKLLCHIIAAEVVDEDDVVAELPTEAEPRVHAALCGDMRVLKQRRQMRAFVNRFLWDGDVAAFLDLIVRTVPARYRYELVKKLMQTTLSKDGLAREQASSTMVMLHDLAIVSQDQAVEGFYRLLWCVGELRLDEPSAPAVVARFVVRAIVDDVLPPDFLDTIPPAVLLPNKFDRRAASQSAASLSVALAKQLVAEAAASSSVPIFARNALRKVWGVGEVRRGALVDGEANMARILEEALRTAGPIISEEARRKLNPSSVKTVDACIATAMRDLVNVRLPFLMHEAVLQALSMAVREGTLGAQDLLLRILSALVTERVLDGPSITQGCVRFLERVDGLVAAPDFQLAKAVEGTRGSASATPGPGEAESEQSKTVRRAASVLIQLSEDLPACLPPTWCSDLPRHWTEQDMPVAFRVVRLYDEEYY